MVAKQNVETIVAENALEGITDTEAQLQAQARKISTVDKMRAHFAAQPKRRIKIRQEGANKQPVPVSVNGYSFLVPTGVMVEVPEQIAEILEEADYI